jgi:hypothetical protein
MDVIACRACGTVNEEASEDVGLLEAEVRRQRRQIARLTGEQSSSMEAHPLYRHACAVLNRWQQECAPSAREPHSDARIKVVIARLKGGYDQNELYMALEGYAKFPFLIRGRRCGFGHPTERKVDAEFIFRNAHNVDRGITMALAHVAPVPPAAALCRVPWQHVWRENRNLIVASLRRHWGHDGEPGAMGRLWPCPFCQEANPSIPGQEPLTLCVADAAGSWLAECRSCGLREERLLAAVVESEGVSA